MTYGNGGGCGGLIIFCGAVDVRSLVGDGVGWIDGPIFCSFLYFVFIFFSTLSLSCPGKSLQCSH